MANNSKKKNKITVACFHPLWMTNGQGSNEPSPSLITYFPKKKSIAS